MLFNNPITPEKIERMLDELWLESSSEILDVGCGRGELINRILNKFSCRAVAIDPDTSEIQKAKEKLQKFSDQLTFHKCLFSELNFPANRFDACFSLGSIHAFGKVGEAFDCALITLKKITKAGGLIVIGDGYWRKPPESEYLQATGIDPIELRTHVENIEAGKKIGLECIYTLSASKEEWDHFEGAFWMAAERELIQNPDNLNLIEKVAKRRAWKHAYLKWGRNTMGFAIYIFLKPMK